MREEYDATGSTSAAVISGLGRTGRLVTSAALILFFSFAALASAPGTDIKVLGTALGAGILIDATVVRALLVPALVSLFGQWNWWLPAGLATLLRVQPSPLAPHGRDRTDAADDVKLPIGGANGRHHRSVPVDTPVTVIDSGQQNQPTIAGAVRRDDGLPLVGTPVTLIDTVGRQVAVVRTGPDGSYRMAVPTGVYLLVASAIGHHPGAFVVTVADRPVGHEFVLPDLDSADPRLPRPAGRSVPAPARAGP
jgi:hypothetical protein